MLESRIIPSAGDGKALWPRSHRVPLLRWYLPWPLEDLHTARYWRAGQDTMLWLSVTRQSDPASNTNAFADIEAL